MKTTQTNPTPAEAHVPGQLARDIAELARTIDIFNLELTLHWKKRAAVFNSSESKDAQEPAPQITTP